MIQNSPPDVLIDELPGITDRLNELLNNHHIKAKTQIIESLISLVIATEIHFEEHAVQFVPHLLENMGHNDWAT